MSGLPPKPLVPAAGMPTNAGLQVGAGAANNLQFFSGSAGTMPPPGAPAAGQPAPMPVQPPGMAPAAQPTVFTPQAATPGFVAPQAAPGSYDDIDFENEEPLLEELGINVEHIMLRMRGIAFFKKVNEDVLQDTDLSGPLLIMFALAFCLLLMGKLYFGKVYGITIMGCLFIYLLINVMSQKDGIDLYRTMSILGYGLMPIVLLAAIGVGLSLQSKFGIVACSACIFWSTAASSRFFATAIALKSQRWLIAYPIGLFYTCFTLLTVF